MHAGAGQHGADRKLSVGDVQMKLVAAPVLLLALAVLFGADIALPRQFFQHAVQFLMALALDAGTALTGFDSGETATRAFLPAPLCTSRLRLLRSLLCRFLF